VPETEVVRDVEKPSYAGESRILFLTDMEGSTSRLERMGDECALEVMRSHNTLIRECLRTHGGLEYAHTGDGLLATFRSATAAVLCSQEVQRSLDRHNRGQNEPIQVRVALHAGETLREEDRFFGAAVNAVFRICDTAKPGQVLASEAIRQLCADPALAFQDRGQAALKGFSEPFRLYEVVW